MTSTQNSAVLTANLARVDNYMPAWTTQLHGILEPLTAKQRDLAEPLVLYRGGRPGSGNLNQQNSVSLFDAFTGAPAPVQTASGQCTAGVSYWDIGVRGDTGPANHASGFTLNPTYSVLDDPADYRRDPTTWDPIPALSASIATVRACRQRALVADGCGGPSGYGVPPGIVDASTPNPVFSLTPAATVDEGNNWINVSWGPLALSDDSVMGGATGNYGGGPLFANYTLAAGSPAIDYVPLTSTTLPTGTVPTLSVDFFGNPRPDAANPNHFDIGAVEFQGGSGVATITGISPSTGVQGTVVPVTISGTTLTLASAVNVSGTGIVVSNVVAVSASTVTATFTIAPNATLGARNVTVTTPAGVSNAVTFTVIAPPAPTLASLTPNTELRGTSVNVTLAGTNFMAGSTVVAVPALAGFSISAVNVVNATTINATFSSSTTAAIGNVNVEVVTAGGASNTLPFAITGPVLTSITPNSGNRGTSFTVTLAGSGLSGTTAVNVSGSGITVSALTNVSNSTVTATFSIATNAAGGARNVTTTSAAGTSNVVGFTVIVPPGALTSISPNAGARGTVVPVILTGTALTGATAVTVSGGGITVSAVTPVSDTQVNATLTITATAALTARNVTVTTPGGVSNPVAFTVVSPGTPTLLSISPTSGLRGTAVPVLLTGTGFTTAGTTVHVTAPANGLTISGVTVTSPTTITATFTTTTGATIGPRSIYVTTPGGTTGTVVYNVTGPVLTSISPVSATRGQTIPVVLMGSGLTGTTAITVPGGGVTVSGITSSATQVNATFTIAATAAGTARNVTVTAPGGVSNSVPFTVVIPPAPTLNSVAPPIGVRGAAVPVTLAGTNFISGASSVAVSGAGVTVSGVTFGSAETLNATFTISTTAALTARTVTVTTPGGASNTVPFTVEGATLTSINPNAGLRGTAALPVTFTGTNLTGTTAITGLGAGVTASAITVVNSTTVTASLAISATATLGIRNLGLTTPIGATNTIPFTVQGAAVTISAPAPALATTPAGTTTKTGTITVTNAATANEALTMTAAPTIAKVGTAGGTFTITGGTCTAATVVAVGGNCTIIVQYAPGASTATATAHVIITGSDMPTATMTGANFTAN